MHEAGLAAEILENAVRAARRELGETARVRALRVRVGEFAGVDAGALRFALEALSRNSPAEGCAIELKLEPMVIVCSCGHRAGKDAMYDVCPACTGGSWTVAGGRDLVLEALDAEAPD
jgi:hydrogenase nickel incorporation protein HypA/HybF